SRKIETARSLCFLNSLNPSLGRAGRRKNIERTKRKIGTTAATKAMILKIIVHSFLGPLQAGDLAFLRSEQQYSQATILELSAYCWRCVRPAMIAPTTIHVRPSVVIAGRGLAVDDAGTRPQLG